MYKVKFDNGYVASFENEPTQADIDAASQHMVQNVKPAPAVAQPKGFFNVADKIGHFLAEGTEQTVRNVVGMGVSVRNMGRDVKSLVTGDYTQKDRSANVPLLGKVDPFVTGNENFGQGVGKMVEGGLTVAGLVEGGRNLGSTVQGVKQFAGAAQKSALEIKSLIAKKAAARTTRKGVSQAEKITDIISPKLNKATRLESLKAGEQLSARELKQLGPEAQDIANKLKTPGVKTSGKSVFTKTSYNPGEEIKNIVEAIKDTGVKLKSGVSEVGRNITRLKIAERKEFTKVGKLVDDYITGKGSKYIPDDANKIITTMQKKIGEIKKIPQRTVDLAGDADKMYDKIWGIAKNQLRETVSTSGKLTQKEILDALRNWNIKASNTAAFEGMENIKKIAIKDVRKVFRDTLVESLPKNIGSEIDQSFKKSHAFIDAMTNIAEKNEILVGAKSQAGKAWTAVKKSAVGAAAGGLVIGGYGVSKLIGD